MPTPQISTFEQLKNFINENLPDNISGVIDPLDIRTSLLRLIDTQELNNAILYANFSPEQTEVWNSLIDKLEQIQIGNNLGLINLTDTPPATGKHRGDVATAGTYTNFKNSEGVALVFTQGELDINFGFIYVAENVAEKILTKKPSNSDASVEGNLIAFSPNIYFDKPTSFSSKNINAPIVFVPIGSGAKINYSTCVRLIADGVNIPDFSRFKKLSGSQAYDNTAGVLNVCFFYFDGIDAWLNLWQGLGISNIDTTDLIAPTPPTVVLGAVTDSTVQLSWSGATDDVGVTSYEVYKNGVLFDTVSASPLMVSGLTGSTAYSFKIKAKDAAGNASVFSNTISATTATLSEFNINFDTLSGATYNSGTNTLASSSGNTGGLNSTPISGDFEVFSTQLTEASVIVLRNNTTVNFNWNTNPRSTFIIGAYYYADTVYLMYGVNNDVGDYSITITDKFLKLKRVGNDCQLFTSATGATWTLRYTKTGIFAGISNLYIQGIFAISQSNLMALKKYK